MTAARCSAEPDVTIVVGGQVFREYSTNLSCWSEFFDAALNSGDSQDTKHFEFQDRDPAEWQWIMALTAPLSNEQVTNKTLMTALSWFHELDSNPGLEKCDEVFYAEGVAKLSPAGRDKPAQAKEVEDVLDALAISTQFSLRRSGFECWKILEGILADSTNAVGSEHLKRISSLLAESDADARDIASVWNDTDPHRMLLRHIQHITTKRALAHQEEEAGRMERILNRVAEFVEQHDNGTTGSWLRFREALANDAEIAVICFNLKEKEFQKT